MPEKVMYMNVK